MMSLKRITAPAAYPLSLEETRAHLRIDTTAEDALIDSYIEAVTAQLDGADGVLQRCLVDQTWKLSGTQPACNCCAGIELPLPPLIEVVSVSSVGDDGSETIMAPDSYRVIDNGSMPSMIVPAGGASWGGMSVVYRAGYAEVDSANGSLIGQIPRAILQYMLMTIADAHQNRQTVIQSTVNRIDLADQLLATFKIRVIG